MRNSSLGSPGVKPLCWADDGKTLLYYARGKLYLREGKEVRRLCSLPLNGSKKLLSCNRLASRIFRIEPRAALIVGEAALVAWMGSIDLVDLHDGKIESLLRSREGFSNPLYFTPVAGNKFLAVWGDYGTNPGRQSVAIWGLDVNLEIRVLYKFAPGTIRHIHGIVPRRMGGGGFYVFTGDMEKDSGIYVASEDFSNVQPLAVGEQRFRAVRGFPVEEGLIYATDSASIENHVYRLYEDGAGSWQRLDDLGVINGPCIYGGTISDGYLFTTTVEPDENRRGFASFLSCSIGPGVRTSEATAVFVSECATLSEVARIKGDGLPLKAFQYGSLQMPSGVAPSSDVWAYARSLKGVDGRAIRLSIGDGND